MRVALYSTVFPAVLRYLRSWHASVAGQSSADFTLVLGLDGVTRNDITKAMGTEAAYRAIPARPGDSPAQVRQRAIEVLVQDFDGIVFVDADDILLPDRVAAAVRGLGDADVYGCSLRLVDEGSRDLGETFTVGGAPRGLGEGNAGARGAGGSGARPNAAGGIVSGPEMDWLHRLTLHNVLGLSNTAYRASTLAKVANVPPDAVAVDWYLAAQACWSGATIMFDDTVHMAYRQHGNNIGRVTAPFDLAYLARATDVVTRHHTVLLERQGPGTSVAAVLSSRERLDDVIAFANAMRDEERSGLYLETVNRPVKDVYRWWEIVAMPELEMLWKP